MVCLLTFGLAISRPGWFPLDFTVFFVGGLALMLGGTSARILRHGVQRIDPVLAAIAEYRAVTEHRGALAGMA